MTAINIVVTPDVALIVTDSRAVAPGRPNFDAPKVLPVPHMALAVATRGTMDSLMKATAAICVAARNFDEARAFLDQAYGQLGLDDAEIFVAGIGSNGPAAFVISKKNTAGKVTDIPYVVATPPVTGKSFDKFTDDPVANMPALLTQQAQDMGGRVGGFMNVTEIGRLGITTYTAGRIAA